MRVIPELVEVVKKRSGRQTDPRGRVGTTRVDIEHQEQKTLEAKYKTEEKEFRILIDEPAMRGGLSRGSTPLGYFMTGAGG